MSPNPVSRELYTNAEYQRTASDVARTTKSFYEADGLGSITSLSHSAGGLAQTYGYDSQYVELTMATPTIPTRAIAVPRGLSLSLGPSIRLPIMVSIPTNKQPSLRTVPTGRAERFPNREKRS